MVPKQIFLNGNVITMNSKAPQATAIGYGGEAGEVCRAYRELEAEDNLDLRVYLTIIEEQYQKLLELGLGTGLGSEVLKLGGVKLLQL